MKNEQSSSAVYGVFFFYKACPSLLGLYLLEGEAEAARQAYIAEQMKDHPIQGFTEEIDCLRDATVVRRLQLGQVPSYNFSN
jgi:hypothetical protein